MYYFHKLLLSAFAVISFLSTSTWAQTAIKPPGGGSDGDPYLVSTLEHLHYLSLNPGGGIFKQIADIDASATRYWDGGKGFLPIGNSSNPFRGRYDGNGHIIKNLYINRPASDDVGFFSIFFGLGHVLNIGLVNVDITGRNYVGGLCGSVNYFNPILYCFVTGKVTGSFSVGGMIGIINESKISYSYSNCNVQGGSYNTGGFIGMNYSSTISNCYAIGDISGKYSTGGLVGDNFSGSSDAISLISSCYFSGTLKSTEVSQTGALVGTNYTLSIVSSSQWNADLTGIYNGVGDNSGILAACSGLTTDQMKQTSNFPGWNFSNGPWLIRPGQTYPALRYVSDNAPFAFRDVISKHSGTFDVSTLLANDYDYETLQNNLVLKIKKLSTGTYDNLHIYFPATARMGDTVTVHYKVGMARTAQNDTIWGNSVASLLIYSNQAPVISQVPSQTIQEDSQLALSLDEITVMDPDDDQFTIHLFAGDNYHVAGTTIIPDLNFNGILQVGIGASDGAFMSDTVFMEITVNSVNDPPELTSIPEKTMQEDSEKRISLNDVMCYDPDGDILSLIIGAGENYSISVDTIRPDSNFNGILLIPVKITDGADTSESKMMRLTITPVNDAPEIVSTPPILAKEGSEYVYAVTTIDVDNTDLTYSLAWRPAGMSISTDGIIRWIPPVGITTSGNVTVIVSDGEWEFSQSFVIGVAPANFIPVTADTSVVTSENEPVEVRLNATDIDGIISNIIIGSDPLYGTTRRSGHTITYTPDHNFSGRDSLTWHAVDNLGAISEPAVLVITVYDVNYAPEISSVASTLAVAGEIYTYEVIAVDADNDSLIFGLTNEPSGMTINEYGQISWQPFNGITTSGEVTLTVSDGIEEVTQLFTIVVEQVVSSKENEITITKVYPNPCKNQFTIDAGDYPAILEIYDLNGKVVHKQQVQGLSDVNIEFLPIGTYILNLNGSHIKIVKGF